jgi:hypothetical protein
MFKAGFIFVGFLVVAAVAATTASASAHEWLKNGAALTQTEPVLSEGGLFVLLVGGKEIACKDVRSVGTISKGIADLTTEIDFLGCAVNAANCSPHSRGAANGLILVVNVPTELVLAEESDGTKILGDQFKQNSATKEFVTIEFTGTGCSPTFPASAKVRGTITAKINNAKEELVFPSPELVGNTLQFFGLAATLFGNNGQMLTAGGTLTAV